MFSGNDATKHKYDFKSTYLPFEPPATFLTSERKSSHLPNHSSSTTHPIPTMRLIIALAISFAAAVTAAPQAGAVSARQQCTVDCTCLNEDRTRSWPDTQRCCSANGGTLDNPVRNHLRFSSCLSLNSSWPFLSLVATLN